MFPWKVVGKEIENLLGFEKGVIWNYEVLESIIIWVLILWLLEYNNNNNNNPPTCLSYQHFFFNFTTKTYYVFNIIFILYYINHQNLSKVFFLLRLLSDIKFCYILVHFIIFKVIYFNSNSIDKEFWYGWNWKLDPTSL